MTALAILGISVTIVALSAYAYVTVRIIATCYKRATKGTDA